MFNGIIYNTGTIHSLKKTKNSLFVGIRSKLKFKKGEIDFLTKKLSRRSHIEITRIR